VLRPAPTDVGYEIRSPDGVLIAGTPGFYAEVGSVFVGTQEVATPTGIFTVKVASPLDGVRRTVDTVEGYLTIGIAVLVVLVGASVWLVVRRALRPVDEMRAEVDAISHGTLHHRVAVPETHDEIARLAQTMNAMLDRLESSSTRQREFVSDASHELRSPLAAMRAALEVTPPGAGAPDWPALRAELLDESRRMEALVGGLLELARADDPIAGPAVDTTEIAEVVADEVARPRPVPVRLGPVADVAVQGRADQLGRVVRNLLDNATRYARSRIDVSVVDRADAVVLTVDDDGPGIPPADRERVLDRFTRLDDARSREDGGAGLGLAIVKAIAERVDGAVRVAEAPLGGARIEVRLAPAVRTPAPSVAG
jgi:signal transduction histidine kinase